MAASLLYSNKETKIYLDMTPSIMIVSFLFLGISMLVSSGAEGQVYKV